MALKFIATTEFLTAGEGGRRHPARQGYQPLLHFPGDDFYLDLVVPSFRNEAGEPYNKGEVLPSTVTAVFTVHNAAAEDILRRRLSIGTTLELTEGTRVVGKVHVTSIVQ